MRSEDRRDNEALYNKMTIREMAENFTEPAVTDDIQVKKTKPYTVYYFIFDSYLYRDNHC